MGPAGETCGCPPYGRLAGLPGLRQSRRSSRLPGSFPIGDCLPRATGQRWPLLTATYGIGHQGGIRQNAGALPPGRRFAQNP
jgi:hypothetical protein